MVESPVCRPPPRQGWIYRPHIGLQPWSRLVDWTHRQVLRSQHGTRGGLQLCHHALPLLHQVRGLRSGALHGILELTHFHHIGPHVKRSCNRKHCHPQTLWNEPHVLSYHCHIHPWPELPRVSMLRRGSRSRNWTDCQQVRPDRVHRIANERQTGGGVRSQEFGPVCVGAGRQMSIHCGRECGHWVGRQETRNEVRKCRANMHHCRLELDPRECLGRVRKKAADFG